MTTEELNKELSQISDSELSSEAWKQIKKLCETGGRSFTMTVPVSKTDSDMIFSELLKRFDEYSKILKL